MEFVSIQINDLKKYNTQLLDGKITQGRKYIKHEKEDLLLNGRQRNFLSTHFIALIYVGSRTHQVVP